jgi:signal transduction histidine kinase
MITAAFRNRSGRAIALGRFLLASFFVVAMGLDKSEPIRVTAGVYTILIFYAVAAIAYMAITWNDWWLEARLGGLAHVVDVLAFGVLNFASQGYTSPFFTFFVFLLLSASLRWGWRKTALTAAAIILLYMLEGYAASRATTAPFDVSRFATRSSYLTVLSSMIILWFASNQRPAPAVLAAGRLRGHAGAETAQDVKALLAYAAGRFGSGRAAFVWSENDEPWSYVAQLDGGRLEQRRFEPGAIEPPVSPEAGDAPFIFDQVRARILRRSGPHRTSLHLSEPLHPALAAATRLAAGIRMPVRSSRICGELLVADVAGLCSDDLLVADEVAEQIAGALDHAELLEATDDAAAMRARLSLARDIHDGIVQFLAGLALKLEGVRNAARAERDVDPDIDDLQRLLVVEQRDLRRYVSGLRGKGRAGPVREMVGSLELLAARMASQWGIACSVQSGAGPVEVPELLELEIHQIVREAVANAVRHGRARTVETRLFRENGSLELQISDDGSGFPGAGESGAAEGGEAAAVPRSLRERVQQLGGTLHLGSGPRGTRVTITLPAETA